MANALSRSSRASARICYTHYRPVAINRLNHWLDELPYERQVALGRRTHNADRTASLIGLQLLKLGMRELGFSGFSLRDLSSGPGGRPAGSDGTNFSISHAGRLIACAIGLGARIGIDLEPLAAQHSVLRLRRCLDAAERVAARRDPREALRIWTAKEAIVKAAGTAGLGDIHAVTVRRARGLFRGSTWHLHAPQLDAGHVVSIATDQPGLPIQIKARARLP